PLGGAGAGPYQRRYRARPYGRLWHRCGRCAGGASPSGPPAGRALVREPRCGRRRTALFAVAAECRRADRALPDAVAVTALGDLSRRLVLLAPAETDDGEGGVTRSFVAATALWAQVLPQAARPDIAAGSLGRSEEHT